MKFSDFPFSCSSVRFAWGREHKTSMMRRGKTNIFSAFVLFFASFLLLTQPRISRNELFPNFSTHSDSSTSFLLYEWNWIENEMESINILTEESRAWTGEWPSLWDHLGSPMDFVHPLLQRTILCWGFSSQFSSPSCPCRVWFGRFSISIWSGLKMKLSQELYDFQFHLRENVNDYRNPAQSHLISSQTIELFATEIENFFN